MTADWGLIWLQKRISTFLVNHEYNFVFHQSGIIHDKSYIITSQRFTEELQQTSSSGASNLITRTTSCNPCLEANIVVALAEHIKK